MTAGARGPLAGTRGVPLDHPALKKGLEGMHGRWMIRRPDGTLRIQACLSPVWDTGLALLALCESGVPGNDARVRRAAQWLLREEIRVPGDWCVQVRGVEGVRVDRAGDIGDAIRKGIAANKPYLIDVDIAADINPSGAGVWELPGLGQSKPGIGMRYQPT